MKKLLILLFFTALEQVLWGQTGAAPGVPTEASKVKPWKAVATMGLTYNQSTITNPRLGQGVNQAGGNMLINFFLSYSQGRQYWNNSIDWKFGLFRFGSGLLEPGSSQKIPFQKSMDQLRISSIYGYRLGKDSVFSIVSGFDILTQATPSYADADGKIPGLFFKNIRNSGRNPIESKFFAPASVLAYVGIGYTPSPKLLIGYSPLSYKGLLVLDNYIASLAGQFNAQGLATASIHGNEVEIKNGVPVFRNSFNQLGSYLLVMYNDRYFKGRFGVNTRLDLYSNYLKDPQKVDVSWNNQFNFNFFKGLSLAYLFNLLYDYDVLVAVTDNNALGGFSGKFGHKAMLYRQLMLQYQITF